MASMSDSEAVSMSQHNGSSTPSRSRKNSGTRYGISLLLSVLAGATILLASVGVWVNNTVFNSDKFAKKVEKSLGEPEVNTALSQYLTNQLMTALDVQTIVAELLPDELDGAAVIFTGALRTVVEEGVQQVLADERVRELIANQVETSHAAFMTVLRGQGPFGEGLSTEGDKVILDLEPIIWQAAEDLERVGVILDKVDLPEDFGKIAVYEGAAVEKSSNILRSAQDTLTLYKRLLWLFLILAPLLTAASIYVATNRRTATRRLGIVIGAVAAAVVFALSQINNAIAGMIARPEPRAAAQVIVENFVGRLKNFNIFLIIVAVVLILGSTYFARVKKTYETLMAGRSAPRETQ